jgi:hypothetical protein
MDDVLWGDPTTADDFRRLLRLRVLGGTVVYVRADAVVAVAEHGANTLVTLRGGAPEYVAEEPLAELAMRLSNELVSS